VPTDRIENPVRSFDACTAGLLEMIKWLKKHKITTVAMESTGTYWIPVFDILGDNGFEVILTNPKQLKNVSGRKTDVSDSQWIQQLHSFGLLQPAFRPELIVRKLRTIFRQRRTLKQQANRSFFRRIQFKPGGGFAKAVTATARKIAIYIDKMITKQESFKQIDLLETWHADRSCVRDRYNSPESYKFHYQ
jgi:transposase